MRPRLPRRLLLQLPGSPRLWILLGLASLLAYGFFEVVDYVFDGAQAGAGPNGLDAAMAHALQQYRAPRLTQVAIDLTSLGSSTVLTLFALVTLCAVLLARDYRGLVHLAVAMLGAALWPETLKALFERPRPPGVLHLVPVTAFSFPSGHSFGAAACYATFAFFFARYVPRLRSEIAGYVLATLVVLTVGLTRIYLGVHHATDVLAGISAGAAWAFVLAALFSLWYARPAPPSPKRP